MGRRFVLALSGFAFRRLVTFYYRQVLAVPAFSLPRSPVWSGSVWWDFLWLVGMACGTFSCLLCLPLSQLSSWTSCLRDRLGPSWCHLPASLRHFCLLPSCHLPGIWISCPAPHTPALPSLQVSAWVLPHVSLDMVPNLPTFSTSLRLCCTCSKSRRGSEARQAGGRDRQTGTGGGGGGGGAGTGGGQEEDKVWTGEEDG